MRRAAACLVIHGNHAVALDEANGRRVSGAPATHVITAHAVASAVPASAWSDKSLIRSSGNKPWPHWKPPAIARIVAS